MTDSDDLIIRIIDKAIGLAIQGEKHRIHAQTLLEENERLKQIISENGYWGNADD